MSELAEKVRELTPGYAKMFAEGGGVSPADPLEFHLYHLARYWSRLVGFCRQTPSNCDHWIETGLGAYVQIGSDFADKLVNITSPVHANWKAYWSQMQAVLYQRPVTLAQIEATSQAFEACLRDFSYDPWTDSPGRRATASAQRQEVQLSTPLSLNSAFRFPLQSSLARREVIIGGLWLLVPVVGWLLNMGHRIAMTHRMQHGL